MDKLNLHKQKLYALIVAAVGLISMFLPWWHISYGGYGGFGGGLSVSVNGLRDLGFISLLGFAAAGGVTFAMGDKSKPFEGQPKMIAAASFAAAGLIAVIQFLRQMSYASFGIWIAILAGVGGAVLVWVIKPEQLGGNKPPAA